MRELLAIAIGFICMPLLMRIKKLNFGVMLLIVGAIISTISGMTPSAVLNSGVEIFTSGSTLNTILTVLMIGVLGALLNHYGILTKIVDSLQQIIHNPKITIMILPPIMGILPVPGGAYLSAPFVDTIGKELSLEPPVRASINLAFRHLTMFLLPFTATMLLISSTVPDVSIYKLIVLNIPYVLVFGGASYFFYLRGVRYEKKKDTKITLKAVGQLLLYSSPIYAIVLINAIFNIPMWVATCLSVIYTFFLCDKKDYLKTLIAGVNLKTVIMLIGVFFIQNTIRAQGEAMALFGSLFTGSTGFVALLAIAAIALVLGLATGMSLVSLSIFLPLIATLPITPTAKLLYVFFAYCWAFIGYYYSPMHLCQILTNEAIGCTLGQTSKANGRLVPILIFASFALYYLYSMIL